MEVEADWKDMVESASGFFWREDKIFLRESGKKKFGGFCEVRCCGQSHASS